MPVYQFSPGDRVSVDARHPYPAGHLDAVVERAAPYQGAPGYRIRWDYGRPRKQHESSGGWQPESALREVST